MNPMEALKTLGPDFGPALAPFEVAWLLSDRLEHAGRLPPRPRKEPEHITVESDALVDAVYYLMTTLSLFKVEALNDYGEKFDLIVSAPDRQEAYDIVSKLSDIVAVSQIVEITSTKTTIHARHARFPS